MSVHFYGHHTHTHTHTHIHTHKITPQTQHYNIGKIGRVLGFAKKSLLLHLLWRREDTKDE